jgi:hypothetical protein
MSLSATKRSTRSGSRRQSRKPAYAPQSWPARKTRRSSSVSSKSKTSLARLSFSYPREGRLRPAEPPQVGADHAVALGERRNDVTPGVPMLGPAVQKNKRRARFSGPCDVHAQPRRLDDLVINSGNSRQVVHHSGRSLCSATSYFERMQRDHTDELQEGLSAAPRGHRGRPRPYTRRYGHGAQLDEGLHESESVVFNRDARNPA